MKEQCRNRSGIEQESGAGKRGECPVEPGHAKRLSLGEAAQHLRPEVALKLRILNWYNRLFEKRFDFLFIFVVGHFVAHELVTPPAVACTPMEFSFLRSMRTARKTRTFTSASEMPTASAISL